MSACIKKEQWTLAFTVQLCFVENVPTGVNHMLFYSHFSA
jgi:hypothetical protein